MVTQAEALLRKNQAILSFIIQVKKIDITNVFGIQKEKINKKSRNCLGWRVKKNKSLKQTSITTKMSQLIFGGLLSTPAPNAPIARIAITALFSVVGIMVGPDHDGINAPALRNSKKNNQNWLVIDLVKRFLKRKD